jgi:hypothetical protein
LGGKLGSSLIFYFVVIDDWRLEIADPRMLPKPILAWAQTGGKFVVAVQKITGRNKAHCIYIQNKAES